MSLTSDILPPGTQVSHLASLATGLGSHVTPPAPDPLRVPRSTLVWPSKKRVSRPLLAPSGSVKKIGVAGGGPGTKGSLLVSGKTGRGGRGKSMFAK